MSFSFSPAIKGLVTEANFEYKEQGVNLQAMDNSHVALFAVKLLANAFKRYRGDWLMPVGVMNLMSLTKVLKCAKDDVCTSKAADGADLNLVYKAKGELSFFP